MRLKVAETLEKMDAIALVVGKKLVVQCRFIWASIYSKNTNSSALISNHLGDDA